MAPHDPPYNYINVSRSSIERCPLYQGERPTPRPHLLGPTQPRKPVMLCQSNPARHLPVIFASHTWGLHCYMGSSATEPVSCYDRFLYSVGCGFNTRLGSCVFCFASLDLKVDRLNRGRRGGAGAPVLLVDRLYAYLDRLYAYSLSMYAYCTMNSPVES